MKDIQPHQHRDAFDPARAERALQAARQLALDHAVEALQLLIDIMHGQLKDGHGNPIPVDQLNLRRLAARDILKLACELLPKPVLQSQPKKVKVAIERDAWDDLLEGIARDLPYDRNHT